MCFAFALHQTCQAASKRVDNIRNLYAYVSYNLDAPNSYIYPGALNPEMKTTKPNFVEDPERTWSLTCIVRIHGCLKTLYTSPKPPNPVYAICRIKSNVVSAHAAETGLKMRGCHPGPITSMPAKEHNKPMGVISEAPKMDVTELGLETL